MAISRFRLSAILSACLAVLLSPAFAKEAKPLFQSDEVLQIRVEAPFSAITKKSERSTDPHPAKISVVGASPEEHAIDLSARGNSRRDKNLCTFPPLRVAFTEKPEDASLFDGQKRLKLVTHCRTSKTYQQYYLLEYTAYKLLNQLTPLSLKVRLAEIEYVDAKNGKTIAIRLGFFIEDADDAAKRNGMKELDVADAKLSQINVEAGARYTLFQYMIGNLDWSMHDAVAGNDCCHNTKLFGGSKEATSDITPIPYDFDYSGLVDTPYSVPPEGISVRSVRQRYYRGFCAHNDAVRKEAARLFENRQALLDVIGKTPDLSKKNRDRTVGYLGNFFELIASDENIEKRLLSKCRE